MGSDDQMGLCVHCLAADLQKAFTTPRPHTLEAPRPSSQDGGNDPVQDVSEDLNRRCLPRTAGFRCLGGSGAVS